MPGLSAVNVIDKLIGSSIVGYMMLKPLLDAEGLSIHQISYKS